MHEERFSAISEAVTTGEEEDALHLVTAALEDGLPPLAILEEGLVKGILTAGELWDKNEYFLPDVVLAASAFKRAMPVLEASLKESGTERHTETCVIGVVEGDMHDLGKNLVCDMLSSVGFDIIDLGINVPPETFVEAIEEHQPAILGLGCYMTTTMMRIGQLLQDLDRRGLRDQVKVMVGGVPTSQAFADEVGADAWGKDGMDAVRKARALIGG